MNQRQTKNKTGGEAFFDSRSSPTLAHESAHPVGRLCQHDSSWGTLHLSTKRHNAGRLMLARAGRVFAIRMVRAGAGMTWTKERIELLTKLWTEGLSASQIAAELGGDVSRNSVLGKANRLGLTHGPAKASSAPRPCKPPPPKPPLTGEPSSHDGSTLASMPTHPVAANQPAVVPPAPVLLREAAIVPRSEGVMILELREFMCRWPLGDPTTPEFRYCGTQALMGLPYCPHHAQIAYQPAAERKRLGSVRARATAPGRRGFGCI